MNKTLKRVQGDSCVACHATFVSEAELVMILERKNGSDAFAKAKLSKH
ncbi:hypothetical protein [Nonlabens sp. YIK11]|nr:hypothetical protein [Nonlabens sp. YIK11]